MLVQSFIKAARLKQWLSRSDCPPAIEKCKVLFDKAYTLKRSSHSDTDAHADEVFVDASGLTNDKQQLLVPIPSDLQPLTSGNKVALRAWFKHHRIVFTQSLTHVGNSLVYFYSQGDKPYPPIPGSIKYIFNKPDGTVAFAIQCHLDKLVLLQLS